MKSFLTVARYQLRSLIPLKLKKCQSMSFSACKFIIMVLIYGCFVFILSNLISRMKRHYKRAMELKANSWLMKQNGRNSLKLSGQLYRTPPPSRSSCTRCQRRVIQQESSLELQRFYDFGDIFHFSSSLHRVLPLQSYTQMLLHYRITYLLPWLVGRQLEMFAKLTTMQE